MKQLYIGRVLTMAQPQYAQAVLVEDGVIRAVGSAAELRKLGGDWEEIPFQGTLLPGFIDPHSHYSQMAYAWRQAYAIWE